jgi:ribonuclease HI
MTRRDYILVFDGGSIGNPGRGYGSYAIRTRDSGSPTRKPATAWQITRVDFPGRVTSNEAEYDTLIAALKDLAESLQRDGKQPGETSVEVRGDSQLVIFQVTGRWKAHEPRMAERRDRVRKLSQQFKRVSFVQQPRVRSVMILGH